MDKNGLCEDSFSAVSASGEFRCVGASQVDRGGGSAEYSPSVSGTFSAASAGLSNGSVSGAVRSRAADPSPKLAELLESAAFELGVPLVEAGEPLPAASCPPESRQEVWGRFSEHYDVFAESVTRPFCEDAAQLVRIRAGERVLDVAAGTGSFALAAADRGADVLATDFSSEMLRAIDAKCALRQVDNVRTAVMDGQQLQLPDSSFQVAGSLFGLMFFPDHMRGLSELHRVLRPGGQVVLGVWAHPGKVEIMRLIGEALMAANICPPQPEQDPHWLELCCPRRIAKSLKDAAFHDVHVVSVTHLWAFDEAEYLASVLPVLTPSWSNVISRLNATELAAFSSALVSDLKTRQGLGPYAVTTNGLIAVGRR